MWSVSARKYFQVHHGINCPACRLDPSLGYDIEACILLLGPLKALIDGTTAEIGDATTSAAEGETIAKTIGVAAADRGLAQGREGGRGLATGLQGHPGTGGRGQGPETVASEEGAAGGEAEEDGAGGRAPDLARCRPFLRPTRTGRGLSRPRK